MQAFEFLLDPAFWYGVVRASTPLALAAMAALIASRAGITNMAIEGAMLMSALFGVLGSALADNAWVGLASSVGIGVLMSLALGAFAIRMRANPILTAIALNLTAEGASVLILSAWTGDKAQSTGLASVNLPQVEIPILKEIPWLGDVVSGHNVLVYLAVASAVLLWYLLYRTPLGLRIRSVGSRPEAALSAGVNVPKTQYIALAMSGALAGAAGAYLSLGYLSMFVKGMSAGRGYIGLAASMIGNHAPFPALGASVIFGFFEQVANHLQVLQRVPIAFVSMIPYVLTIAVYTTASYRRMQRKKRTHKFS